MSKGDKQRGQRKGTNGFLMYEKMINITQNSENANLKHIDVLFFTHQLGRNQIILTQGKNYSFFQHIVDRRTQAP